ncbi:LytTR family DNA-binding domain-containing protein [Chryseolinea sp. T2]|uniref:LytR/AlgR family response regulator transcription factor n=1 Tax=Chryseolinea sp. T2 TaxID=3129255 RepID=UPI003078795B
MKINCLIVDDEPLARNLLTDYVRKVPQLNLVDTLSSPLQVMDALRNNEIDVMFLDVQMPDLTGISLLKALQKKPLIVLTTAYSEYALEGYELDVADYLLKPITFERFLKAVEKITQRLAERLPSGPSVAPVAHKQGVEASQPFVFVKDGTKLIKLRIDDIQYVEGLKDYVTIHTKTQKIVSLQRLKALEEELPADKFIRVHNSFIVAFNAIDVIHKNDVQVGATMIPIGETYKKSFRDFIDRNRITG